MHPVPERRTPAHNVTLQDDLSDISSEADEKSDRDGLSVGVWEYYNSAHDTFQNARRKLRDARNACGFFRQRRSGARAYGANTTVPDFAESQHSRVLMLKEIGLRHSRGELGYWQFDTKCRNFEQDMSDRREGKSNLTGTASTASAVNPGARPSTMHEVAAFHAPAEGRDDSVSTFLQRCATVSPEMHPLKKSSSGLKSSRTYEDLPNQDRVFHSALVDHRQFYQFGSGASWLGEGFHEPHCSEILENSRCIVQQQFPQKVFAVWGIRENWIVHGIFASKKYKAGFAMLDTGCSRMVAGARWYVKFKNALIFSG